MLYNKTTYSLLIFISVLITEVNAQEVYLETGVESAFFKDYVNNLGENSLDLNYAKSQSFFIESGLRFNLYEDRLKWDTGLSYNTYKINTGFYSGSVSIPLTYNLKYASIKAGILFSIINEPKFKLNVHTHLSMDWLVSGTSTYRNVVNDLYKDNTFDKTLIRFHKGLSAEYSISNTVATYIKYNIADSFREKNKDSTIEESYIYHSDAISFGLLFNIRGRRNTKNMLGRRRNTKCYGGF